MGIDVSERRYFIKDLKNKYGDKFYFIFSFINKDDLSEFYVFFYAPRERPLTFNNFNNESVGSRVFKNLILI